MICLMCLRKFNKKQCVRKFSGRIVFYKYSAYSLNTFLDYHHYFSKIFSINSFGVIAGISEKTKSSAFRVII